MVCHCQRNLWWIALASCSQLLAFHLWMIQAKWLRSVQRRGVQEECERRIDANIPSPIIMAMGRWRSIAWESYVLHDTSDLQRAMQSMWSAASAPSTSPALRVGNLVPSVVLADALAEFDDAVPCDGIERVPALHSIFYRGARSDVERRQKKPRLS